MDVLGLNAALDQLDVDKHGDGKPPPVVRKLMDHQTSRPPSTRNRTLLLDAMAQAIQAMDAVAGLRTPLLNHRS